tara:strand:- start:1761 stop:1871 length:111 start_codon:yes stop_codon:yes gene_type:complete
MSVVDCAFINDKNKKTQKDKLNIKLNKIVLSPPLQR